MRCDRPSFCPLDRRVFPNPVVCRTLTDAESAAQFSDGHPSLIVYDEVIMNVLFSHGYLLPEGETTCILLKRGV